MRTWEQPTPEQTAYVRTLQKQLRLTTPLMDAQCQQMFSRPYAEVTKWQCSALIDELIGWKAIPADLERLRGQMDLFSL